MEPITLHGMVQKTIANNHNYCAVDRNGRAYSFAIMPQPHFGETTDAWDSIGELSFIGEFELTCDWTDTLIDVNDLTLRNVQ